MDCARDAAEIEAATRAVTGVEAVKVSVASQIMTLNVGESPSQLAAVEQAVIGLGYRLDRLGATDARSPASHLSPGYRRALLIVVMLNVGYGIVETVAGFASSSQALKADALDFLGDGLITLLAVAAMSWSLAWRARAALIQALFLGALGLGVLLTTAYHIVAQTQPDAELMGAFGFIALAVNIAAALALVPHRTGDANARAVWLFSRNDAIGNAAVIVAAGLVAWTDTPWPDLIVAAAIAGLFLHSSWAIVRDARRDLGESSVGR